jgi:hypothetical protein
MVKTEYYKVKKERWDYLGIRYFKVNFNSDKVTQICIDTGDVKKGKSNTFGVYLIGRETFFSNYFGRYVDTCKKGEYDKMFNKVVKFLK